MGYLVLAHPVELQLGSSENLDPVTVRAVDHPVLSGERDRLEVAKLPVVDRLERLGERDSQDRARSQPVAEVEWARSLADNRSEESVRLRAARFPVVEQGEQLDRRRFQEDGFYQRKQRQVSYEGPLS
jgi:hypothetical protein